MATTDTTTTTPVGREQGDDGRSGSLVAGSPAGDYGGYEVDGELVAFGRSWMPRAVELLMSKRCSIVAACNAAGITTTTFYRWKARDRAFRQACFDAECALVDAVESSLYKQAIDRGDVEALKFVLTNRAPDRWSNKRQVEMFGAVDHRLEVTGGVEPAKIPQALRIEMAAKLLAAGSDEVVEGSEAA